MGAEAIYDLLQDSILIRNHLIFGIKQIMKHHSKEKQKH